MKGKKEAEEKVKGKKEAEEKVKGKKEAEERLEGKKEGGWKKLERKNEEKEGKGERCIMEE